MESISDVVGSVPASEPVSFGLANRIFQAANSTQANAQAGTSYTLTANDWGGTVVFSSGSPVTVTVPAGLPTGFWVNCFQLGAGQVTFAAASGVTLNALAGALATAGQYAGATIMAVGDESYVAAGSLV